MQNSTSHTIALFAAFIQVPLLGIICFGDFGFYFAGAMGDFNAWVAWVLVYLMALVIGVVAALMAGKRRFATIQILSPLVLMMGYVLYISNPGTKFDAKDYQHLVGKTPSEVDLIINRNRIQTSGLEGRKLDTGEIVSYRFQHYHGMQVIFSNDDRVVEVRPWPPEY